MLSRLGLKFPSSSKIRYQGQVYGTDAVFRKLPLELAYGLNKGLGLHISYSSTHLGNDYVVFSGLAEKKHSAFDFIRDMRYNLHCPAKVCTLSLLGNHGVIDFSCSHIVRLRGMDAQKALVMTEIKVGLSAILRYITFTVLVWIESSRVNVNIRIELLNSHPKSPGLKKFGERCCDYAFPQGRSNTSCYENIFGFHLIYLIVNQSFILIHTCLGQTVPMHQTALFAQ